MKVIRWSTEIIKASDLKPQHFEWGGYKANALCFCPFTDENDYRYTFWLNDLKKHHKKELFPNIYNLDLSNFEIKTEKELIILGKKAYYDTKISDYIRSLGICITLANYHNKLDIVEFKIYSDNKNIIIKD